MGEYIRQQFQQWGTVITDEFQMPGRILDVVPGSRGADDNATGIAVLLALARGIAEQPPLNYAVQCVAFDSVQVR